MVFTKNGLGSSWLFRYPIARETRQDFKDHCYLTLTLVAVTVKNDVVCFFCTSFITHMRFWRNKNRELRPFLKGPLQTGLHLGSTLPVHTWRRVARETRNKDDFMHSKQKNASSTSNLYTLRMADNLLCFSNRSYKNSHKTLLYLLVYLLLIFKSGM